MRLQVCSMSRDDGGVESFGELVLQAPALAIFLVPLGLVGGDLRFVRRHFLEDEFANRKDLEPMIAEDADVKFAALDVFLGDDVVVVFLVDELHALLELLVGLDERRLRNAERRLFLERLDEDGKLEPLAAARCVCRARWSRSPARGCDGSRESFSRCPCACRASVRSSRSR